MVRGRLRIYLCQVECFRRNLTQALKWAKCKVGGNKAKLALRDLEKDLLAINPSTIPPRDVKYHIERVNAVLKKNDCDSAKRIIQYLNQLNMVVGEAEQYVRKKLAIGLGQVADDRVKNKKLRKRVIEFAKIADSTTKLPARSSTSIDQRTLPKTGWPQMNVNNIHFSLDKIYSKHLEEVQQKYDLTSLQQALLRVVRNKLRGGSIYSVDGIQDNTLLYVMKEIGQKKASVKVISDGRNHHSTCTEFDFGTDYEFINVI